MASLVKALLGVLLVAAGAAGAPSTAAPAENVLLAGQTLASGHSLTAGNGVLLMAPSGDLQLCRTLAANGTSCASSPLWSTGTAGNPGAFAQLALYGVLNVMPANASADDPRLWQSHTMHDAGCAFTNQTCPTTLVITDRGQAVLHNGTGPTHLGAVLWQTPTKLPPKNARNVVVIVVDDLRPQMNYAFNQSYMITPNFDKLAKSGTVFNRAYVQFAVCNPSRNSFMTGRRPDHTAVWNFQNSFRGAGLGPGQSWTTLPGFFKREGWATVGGGKLFHPCCGLELQDYPHSWTTSLGVDHFWFFNRGMCNDSFAEDPYCEKDCPASFSACPSSYASLDEYYDHRLATHGVSALATLANQSDPFAMFLGFRRPHNNWVVPAEYFQMYPREDVKVARHNFAPANVPPIAFNSGGFHFEDCTENPVGCVSNLSHPMSTQFQQEARQGYYAAVTWVDSQIGRVLDQLTALGLDDNTVVALWGDHGWQLGELGEWHKHTNFESATRTPLLMRVPGKAAAQDKRVDSLVEMVDMYATLVELAGIPDKPVTDGVSFASLFDDPSAPHKNASFSQYARCPKNMQHLDVDHSCDSIDRRDITVMGYSVRTAEYRYTEWLQFNGSRLAPEWDAPTWGIELYDHRNDTGLDLDQPAEWVNVANQTEYRAVQASLHQLLRANMEMSDQAIQQRNQALPGFPCHY